MYINKHYIILAMKLTKPKPKTKKKKNKKTLTSLAPKRE